MAKNIYNPEKWNVGVLPAQGETKLMTVLSKGVTKGF